MLKGDKWKKDTRKILFYLIKSRKEKHILSRKRNLQMSEKLDLTTVKKIVLFKWISLLVLLRNIIARTC